MNTYESLAELVAETLCQPSGNTRQHNGDCLNRLCNKCGVDKVQLSSEIDEITDVIWTRYEYKNVHQNDGSDIRKIQLVKKETQASEMIAYFKTLLQTFPAHEFRSKWQTQQQKHLLSTLPIGHCIAIHDYSENYKCIAKEEIQAAYFQRVEVSVHVTVLHRHAALETDGHDSTEDNPSIITEQFFVISPDPKHDHHFTHTAQGLVIDSLRSANSDFHTLHEFTDVCSAQYKSCHCIGSFFISRNIKLVKPTIY